MRPHIVICNDFGSINGGAAKVAITSSIGLSELGYDVTFFCGVGPIDPVLEKKVSRVICLGQNDILNNPSRFKAMFQGLWNYKAEKELSSLLKSFDGKVIVHIHGWTKSLTASIVRACHRNKITPFISIHDYFAACPNGGFYNYKKEEICKLKSICLNCFFCNCDSRNYAYKIWRFLRQIIQDKYIRKSEQIVYIGTSRFSYNAIKESLVSKRMSLVRNPIIIYDGPFVECYKNDSFLFVGRISKEKGVDLFCEAISKTNSNGVVIGSGDELDKYKQKYPKIKFEGWKKMDEVVPYIQEAKALIVSSRYFEGSPLIVPEVQCYGVPCIVPDKCAASETIIDGVNGIIFTSGNVDSLCDAINKIKEMNSDSLLFQPGKWKNEYVSLKTHLNELIKAYGVDQI